MSIVPVRNFAALIVMLVASVAEASTIMLTYYPPRSSAGAGPNFASADGSDAFASASFFETYAFTVNGGAGTGYFLPCLSAFAGLLADASASFVGGGRGIGVAGGGRFGFSTCFGAPLPGNNPLSFTFGDTVLYDLQLTARSMPLPLDRGGEIASASLSGFEFFDAQGNLIDPPSYTFVPTTPDVVILNGVPEPSALHLMLVGLITALLGCRIVPIPVTVAS